MSVVVHVKFAGDIGIGAMSPFSTALIMATCKKAYQDILLWQNHVLGPRNDQDLVVIVQVIHVHGSLVQVARKGRGAGVVVLNLHDVTNM